MKIFLLSRRVYDGLGVSSERPQGIIRAESEVKACEILGFEICRNDLNRFMCGTFITKSGKEIDLYFEEITEFSSEKAFKIFK